jgi:DHA3 family tetracycline resistance protein-like MFS transporter
MKKLDPITTYLFSETTASVFYSLAFTAMSLYEIEVAKLSPLQLVLVGTTLEISVLVWEIPTGIVADVYSRRLSVIIGLILVGMGFLLEGMIPIFLPILLAQVLWGLGYTFTSGATQAWLSDEVGEKTANRIFLRANKWSLGGSLAGMLLAILTGSWTLHLPILISGGMFVLLAFSLVLFMPETGFQPTAKGERNTFQHMTHTFLRGLHTVRKHPRLKNILGMGLFFGLYSEGFDRLWVKHILARFTLPAIFGTTEIAFFGILRAGSALAAMGATMFLERRLDASQATQIARSMKIITLGIAASILLFALSPFLGYTMIVYVLISSLRSLVEPLTTAWVNQHLDSDVRATILSMTGQVDALGQISGGPFVGAVANLVSVQAAIALSGVLLTPALFFIRRADR